VAHATNRIVGRARYRKSYKGVYHIVAARFSGVRAAPGGSERSLKIDGSSELEGEFNNVNARLICFAEEADASLLVNPLPCILEFAVAHRELR
jgi:hypothetical protein